MTYLEFLGIIFLLQILVISSILLIILIGDLKFCPNCGKIITDGNRLIFHSEFKYKCKCGYFIKNKDFYRIWNPLVLVKKFFHKEKNEKNISV